VLRCPEMGDRGSIKSDADSPNIQDSKTVAMVLAVQKTSPAKRKIRNGDRGGRQHRNDRETACLGDGTVQYVLTHNSLAKKKKQKKKLVGQGPAVGKKLGDGFASSTLEQRIGTAVEGALTNFIKEGPGR